MLQQNTLAAPAFADDGGHLSLKDLKIQLIQDGMPISCGLARSRSLVGEKKAYPGSR